MKKIVLIISSVLLSSFTVFAWDEYDVKVKVVWGGSVDSQKVCPVTFSDGTQVNFSYWKFDNPIEMYFLDVVDQCDAKYNELMMSMLSGEKISSAQAKANMKWWKEHIDAKLEEGYRLQTYNNTLELEAFAQMYGTDSYEYQNKFYEIALENDALAESIDNKFGVLQQKINNEIADAKGNINTKTAILNQKTEALSNTQGMTEAQIRQLKAEQEKAAMEVAQWKSALNKLKDTKSATIVVGDHSVSHGIYTNDIKRITRWLGSHNGKSIGFVRPVNPVTSNKYTSASQNIVDWMFDFGIVGYRSMEMLGASADKGNVYKYENAKVRKFYETHEDSSETTNVVASFCAPTNWVDGVTIICTNGVYSLSTNNVATSGAFAFVNGELRDCYYNVGGKTYSMSSRGAEAGKILAIQVSSSSSSASYVTFDTLGEMQSSQNDLTKYIMPLYKFDANGKVEADMRTSLNAVMMEY